MASYVIQFSFTDKGVEDIKESPARVERAKQTVRDLGGEVRAFYAVLGGAFDTMFVVEAPDDEAVAAMALAVARMGYVRTQTHRLFTEDEFRAVVQALP